LILKYGISAFLLRPQQMVDIAVGAEALGYDSIWFGEHLIAPSQHKSEFPIAGDLGMDHAAFNGNIPFFDPYATACYLAALTKTIKFGTSVSIVPLHEPFQFARTIMTADVLSNGRFMLGVGSGWLKEEFDIMGIDFATRGKRLDEILDVMTKLFTEEEASYSGEVFQVPPVNFSPKPLTRPHPPYIIGGHSKPALRRAAQRGNGWFATGLSPDLIAPLIASVREMREAAGRADLPFEISCHLPAEPDEDLVARYEKVGVERIVVSPWTRGRDAVPGIERFAQRFIK
jgi:probable F420-dependent oxidoreductase